MTPTTRMAQLRDLMRRVPPRYKARAFELLADFRRRALLVVAGPYDTAEQVRRIEAYRATFLGELADLVAKAEARADAMAEHEEGGAP